MKLRNKKTGEIREVENILVDGMFSVNSLAELNAEWEDAPEEPKGIKSVGNIGSSVYIELGSKEESERAVEKLQAWKRLKDNGFKFEGHNLQQLWVKIWLDHGYTEMKHDLDLLFGDEE